MKNPDEKSRNIMVTDFILHFLDIVSAPVSECDNEENLEAENTMDSSGIKHFLQIATGIEDNEL